MVVVVVVVAAAVAVCRHHVTQCTVNGVTAEGFGLMWLRFRLLSWHGSWVGQHSAVDGECSAAAMSSPDS